MPGNSAKALEFSIRSGRNLIRPDIQLEPLEARTPTELPAGIQIARVASLEARSEAIKLGDSTTVVLDEVLSHWLFALWRFQRERSGKHWLMYFLHHYFAVRIIACGLYNEARAFNRRFRAEMRLLRRDESAADLATMNRDLARIERFMVGHELGHIAYKDGRATIQKLRTTVEDCAADFTRLLRVTFTGDRSILTDVERDERYEDIVDSVKEYLQRFVFNEFAEDGRRYERDLRDRHDYATLEQRRRRFEVFARIFEKVDFVGEAFCDIYALEVRLQEAGNSRTRAAAITLDCWENLHALFALTAMDSLARDRLVAARAKLDRDAVDTALAAGTPSSLDEFESLHRRRAEIDAGRHSDRALLGYQTAMIKAIYRRVVFMNYVTRHPLLDDAETQQMLAEAGDNLESKFIGACGSIRFNGIRLEMDEGGGFGDVCKSADSADLNRIWRDLTVRIPGMNEVISPHKQLSTAGAIAGDSVPPHVYTCQFCGSSNADARLMVSSGRAIICDRCVLVAEKAFTAMPEDRPRRIEVTYGIFGPVEEVERADVSRPHCRFCEVAPAPGEPLVSGGNAIICTICAEAVAALVRARSPGSDPDYFEKARKSIAESLAKAEEMPFIKDIFLDGAASKQKELDRELSPVFPGHTVWRLFTETTIALHIPATA